MAHCVWLLTFEHPSDLPPIYERFGRLFGSRSVKREVRSGLSNFFAEVIHSVSLICGDLHIILLNP